MRTEIAVKREINRLARRKEHLLERIQQYKSKGECYSHLYAEMEQAIGKIEALTWVKNLKLGAA